MDLGKHLFRLWHGAVKLSMLTYRQAGPTYTVWQKSFEIKISWFKKIRLKMACMSLRPFFPCYSELPYPGQIIHDDVIKWKYFPRYWPFVRGIHPHSPHKGHWRGALVFPLICAWINVWVNNREAGDLRRHRALYDVTVTLKLFQAKLMSTNQINF